jgi:hypothetical protein
LPDGTGLSASAEKSTGKNPFRHRGSAFAGEQRAGGAAFAKHVPNGETLPIRMKREKFYEESRK